MLRSASLDALAGCSLAFKCENFQRVGAFKFRGASNAVWSLGDAVAARGVVTHSSGNHGAALALAARLRGIPAHVVVPEGAVAAKVAAIRAYGAIVHTCAPTLEARDAGTASRFCSIRAVIGLALQAARLAWGLPHGLRQVATEHEPVTGAGYAWRGS